MVDLFPFLILSAGLVFVLVLANLNKFRKAETETEKFIEREVAKIILTAVTVLIVSIAVKTIFPGEYSFVEILEGATIAGIMSYFGVTIANISRDVEKWI